MRMLCIGDRVRFDGAEHEVVALDGLRVRLAAECGGQVVMLTHLIGAEDFALIEQHPAVEAPSVVVDLLEDVPAELAQRARWWERHLVEIETGLPQGAPAGTAPRAQYDPAATGLGARERAKVLELSSQGEAVSQITIQRMRRRYRQFGVRGLIDGRRVRPCSGVGRADARFLEVLTEVMRGETERSSGTRDRMRHRVERIVVERYGPGEVPLPSKATFNRLTAALDVGRHTFGAATTRRSLAGKPQGPYTVALSARPGQYVHIDSTPLDVLALFDDGIGRRMELIAAVDIATRTICAAVLRPKGAKAVDASLLLARMLVPEPMRPGWDRAAAMTASRLPHRSLEEIDARMAGAAARPVIAPEEIGCDRGKVYLSEAFTAACRHLGISLQPSRPRTSPDNAVIERTFLSINTLFCQYVAGYTGRDVGHRGRDVTAEPLWSPAQLQDLFDQWAILGWQSRPHEGLKSPDTGRVLSPNEMYSVLVAAAGYVPLALTGEDYIELLPSSWRAVNDYGIRLQGRTYDAKALGPLRRRDSGVIAKRGLWQVHYDPYDPAQVWVRDHRGGGFIAATWTHLPMVTAPFADYTWRHAQRIADDRGSGDPETAAARALSDLLATAGNGPAEAKDREIAARTRAATSTHRPPKHPEPETEGDAEPHAGADSEAVVPFGIFDARAEAERWAW
jgi:transposase InsO family protein